MCFKKLASWMNPKLKKLTIWDFSVIKLVLIIIGMIIGSFIPMIVRTYVWYLVAVAFVGWVYLMYVIFRK